ncbi:MAG: peptidoglycan-binding domain-containing protein [Pseudomonadota bacterium]
MTKIKTGQNGAHVKDLQTRLNKAGAKPKLKVDGFFGEKTKAVVKAFQKKNKLKPDGIAGVDTMMVLTGGKDGVPEWTLPDPEMVIRVTKDYVRDAQRRQKKELSAMSLWRNDPKVAKLIEEYTGQLKEFEIGRKMYDRDSTKVLAFKKDFDRYASRGQASACRPVLKAATRTQEIGGRNHTRMAVADISMQGVFERYTKIAVEKAA